MRKRNYANNRYLIFLKFPIYRLWFYLYIASYMRGVAGENDKLDFSISRENQLQNSMCCQSITYRKNEKLIDDYKSLVYYIS